MGSEQQVKVAFGDFQTPRWFCEQVCQLLLARGCRPATIIEPTCGEGNFLLAALDSFPTAVSAIGLDINPGYIGRLQHNIKTRPGRAKITVQQGDFFQTDWPSIVQQQPAPRLILGNPPWVTNAQLSTIESDNLPPKHNHQNQAGITALTGASNFDISEWMILNMLQWAERQPTLVAVLCKTSVARKLLAHLWAQDDDIGTADIFLIDSKALFDASVDACLFIYDSSNRTTAKFCNLFSSITAQAPVSKIGYQRGQIIANLDYFEQWQHLQNRRKAVTYRWRSGIKHDCASVMELHKQEGHFINKLGETYELESRYIYPMLKSSDLANSATKKPARWLLVTQQTVGEKTSPIKQYAPKTWAYLESHRDYFTRRKSTIYKNRPPFSIFGVGDYSFALWKVAIAGLYKQLNFVVIAPHEDKPVMLDDTCYFLACDSEAEAYLVADLLNSAPAQQFFEAFVFWDAKRPITAKILNKLNIPALAQELGYADQLATYHELQPSAQQLNFLAQIPV